MSNHLQRLRRERELEKIRGKRKRRAAPAPSVSPRAQYVLDTYRLYELPSGAWRAESLRSDGTVFSAYERPTRAAAILEARRQWGHMNHRDEAEAFERIFPSQGAR